MLATLATPTETAGSGVRPVPRNTSLSALSDRQRETVTTLLSAGYKVRFIGEFGDWGFVDFYLDFPGSKRVRVQGSMVQVPEIEGEDVVVTFEELDGNLVEHPEGRAEIIVDEVPVITAIDFSDINCGALYFRDRGEWLWLDTSKDTSLFSRFRTLEAARRDFVENRLARNGCLT